MRHIIPPPAHHHKPTPDFKNHSRVLAMIMVLIHPFLVILCMKFSEAGAYIVASLFNFLGKIYGEGSSLEDFNFTSIAESSTIYRVLFYSSLLFVSLCAGNFHIFRIKKFWPNFFISIILLVIGLTVFAPEVFAMIIN